MRPPDTIIGRRTRGWRGRQATRWVYAGAALMLLAYVGSRNSSFAANKTSPNYVMDSYTTLDARAGLSNDRYQFSAFIQNLTDERGLANQPRWLRRCPLVLHRATYGYRFRDQLLHRVLQLNARAYVGLPSARSQIHVEPDAVRSLQQRAQGSILALRTSDGKTLWHAGQGQSMQSSPITYELDGRQYVVLAADDSLFGFTLPAH